jgi:uncharacterized membrane protein (UPF0127 family)
LKEGAIYSSQGEHCLVPRVFYASRWWDRARGLLGLPPLNQGEGLLISPCSSIHTIGMRYPIDVVFLNAAWTVVKIVERFPAARFCGARLARLTLELPAGEVDRMGIVVGERLIWREGAA